MSALALRQNPRKLLTWYPCPSSHWRSGGKRGRLGDSRAEGTELYGRSELIAMMLRQQQLCYYDANDLKKGLIVDFLSGRVAVLNVYDIS
jgi:hypothetical protein